MSNAEDPPPLDLVLRGGRVFDPDSATTRNCDVGIRDGVIATIEESLADHRTGTVVDVAGSLLVPGLIDLHLHAYRGATHWGIDADAASVRSGVVAWVDAGSAGAYTFAGLLDQLRASPLDARAFLNIAGGGLTMPHGELLAAEAADVEAAARVARAHPERIVGFKLRASPNTVGDHARSCLEAVRRAADDVGLPVMVHVSESPPTLRQVLDYLRSGDLLTHCFTPYDNAIVDDDGAPRPEVREALERGVLLDLGHGSGSLSFRKAEAWAAAGLPMPIVSTDLHSASMHGPAFDACTVASKMLVAGFSLGDVLRGLTILPGRWLGRATRIEVGAPADVAVLAIDEGTWRYWDSRDEERIGSSRIRARMTLVAGRPAHVAPDLQLRRLPRR